ncbi:MAG: TldD/PmbA family protein, partial [Acidimicrobiaceae bacterium]|nr:TldD/PmbA family protein [Acidimicrobiaceae bacterium]
MIDESVVGRALEAALRTGGDFAEIFAEDRRGTAARLDDGRVEDMASGRDRGAGIRVVFGETTGFAHTSDLTEAGLTAAASAAAAAARGGGGGTRTVAMSAPGPAAITSAEILPETVSKADKVALLTRADEAARSTGGAIRQVSVIYGDSRRRILVANSDGLWATDDQVKSRFAV